MSFSTPAEAGPSRLPAFRDTQQAGQEMIEIPSTGLQFFEYRRRLFLAGLPLPTQPPNGVIPPTYLVPAHPPDPLPALQPARVTSTAVKKLEDILREEGSEELQENWDAGVSRIARSLHDGKKLITGLRLGLVIKILKASWIQDGLWPKDELGRPVKPPNSPIVEGVELFPEESTSRPEEEQKKIPKRT
ncbi:hypothetical protein I302_105974 [Kwoniella bestiolae CBS 10118]|uniref:Uncharacterized protein n=1 Tax=Kwoniella bestiolae CBS 10118 TaxID=1296100 RepID=A0A1B9G2P0_9TREE|nr:hypothetical protein I302_05098 [Kwoniella bestiolae CBS 10118]OCF25284.1 hypothetical protein I302_05098 [Kwoniella bestiolae CBS 10118]